MTVTALVLAAILAVAVVLFVARPFLRSGRAERASPPPPPELERLRLLEERDRALAALKELEFDHRTGKITDGDYAELLPRLRREAAEALRALDGGPPEASPAPEHPARQPQGRA